MFLHTKDRRFVNENKLDFIAKFKCFDWLHVPCTAVIPTPALHATTFRVRGCQGRGGVFMLISTIRVSRFGRIRTLEVAQFATFIDRHDHSIATARLIVI